MGGTPSQGTFSISHRRPVGALVLIAPISLGLAVSFWLGPGDVGLKCAGSLLLGGLAVALIVRDRPKRETALVDRASLRVEKGKLSLSLQDCVLELRGRAEHESGRAAPEYEVALVGPNNERIVLSESSCPARAIKPILRLFELADLSVVPGWGLDETAVSRLFKPKSAQHRNDESVASAGVRVLSGQPFSTQRPVAAALLFGSVFVATATMVVFSRRLEETSVVSQLSWLLPSIGAAVALILGLVTATLQSRVKITASTFVLEQRLLGVSFRRRVLSKRQVLGAWAVSPDAGTPLHLLIASSMGPFSVRCAGDGAVRMAEALMKEVE